jgi:hypothetical protein
MLEERAGIHEVEHSPTREMAESRLRRSAYPALKDLSCDFRAGVLTLRGFLPSYYLKQVALAAVAKVEGVERINDQVEVGPARREFLAMTGRW